MAQPPVDFDFDSLADLEVVRFPDGGVVFLKGAAGDSAYIVRSGKVEIREGGRALEAVVPHGLFGEMALIDPAPRSASAVAVGATELAVIDRATFERLLRQSPPDFAIGVMRLMARRLRASTPARPPAETDILPSASPPAAATA